MGGGGLLSYDTLVLAASGAAVSISLLSVVAVFSSLNASSLRY